MFNYYIAGYYWPFHYKLLLVITSVKKTIDFHILYINSLRPFVCDGGFGGWGKGEANEAAVNPWRPMSVCDKMWFAPILFL
jgi:hypothetical protein